MLTIPLQQVNNFLLNKQHLTPQAQLADAARITNDAVGLHATVQTTPYLSLFARSPAFSKTGFEHLLYGSSQFAKIRCIRKTMFIHTTSMVPLVFAATSTLVGDASRKYMLARGVSEQLYTQRSSEIQNLLIEGDKTASEIRAALQAEEDISAILYTMCDTGLLIRRKPVHGWKDKTHSYGLFRNHFPNLDLTGIDEGRALSMLVEKYISAYGPVSEEDIIWWLGLGKSRARRALNAIRSRVCEIEIKSLPGSFLLLVTQLDQLHDTPGGARGVVNVLPALDSYLMGYKLRARYLDPRIVPLAFDRSGNVTATILLDGKIIGVWDFEDGDPGLFKFLLFKGVPQSLKNSFLAQGRLVGAFMCGTEVDTREATRMTPLTERTAGGFMTPLKDQ